MHVYSMQFSYALLCKSICYQKAQAIKIQSMFRMHNQKSHYINMNACAIKIQCFVRYCQANMRRHELLESLELKRTTSACIIQCNFRMHYCAINMLSKSASNQNSKYVQNAQPKISLHKYECMCYKNASFDSCLLGMQNAQAKYGFNNKSSKYST